MTEEPSVPDNDADAEYELEIRVRTMTALEGIAFCMAHRLHEDTKGQRVIFTDDDTQDTIGNLVHDLQKCLDHESCVGGPMWKESQTP